MQVELSQVFLPPGGGMRRQHRNKKEASVQTGQAFSRPGFQARLPQTLGMWLPLSGPQFPYVDQQAAAGLGFAVSGFERLRGEMQGLQGRFWQQRLLLGSHLWARGGFSAFLPFQMCTVPLCHEPSTPQPRPDLGLCWALESQRSGRPRLVWEPGLQLGNGDKFMASMEISSECYEASEEVTRLSLELWKASWRKGPERSLEDQQELAKKELARQPKLRESIFQSMEV